MQPRALTAVVAAGLILFGTTVPVRGYDFDGDGVDDAFDFCNNTPAGGAVDAEV